MKRICLLCLVIALLGNACVSHKPVALSTESLHDGAIRVTPAWQSKRTVWSKAWPFIVGPLAMGTFFAVRQNADPQFYSNKNTGAPYPVGTTAAVGAGLGLMVPGYIPFSFFRKKSVRSRTYQTSEEDKWVSAYGNYVVRERAPGGRLLLIPYKQVKDYDQTEQQIKEKAERERREAEERVRQAEMAREETAYQNFVKYDSWQYYLDHFPNGRYKNEVLQKGELLAYKRVTTGSGDSWETYIKYFPQGEHSQAIRQVKSEIIQVQNLRAQYYEANTLEAYNKVVETGRNLQTELTEKRGKIPASDGYASQIISGLANATGILITSADERLSKKQIERTRRLELAKEWVIGESLCWTTSSVKLDENGKEVPGTSAKMAIRVVIEEINPERTRFKVRIKELFSYRLNKNVDSFRMETANRVWQPEEVDWLDPTSEEFDFKKCN
ncbi:hypothetical protein [Larkinella sp.]|uniref:hypothetical protein n=1 Tax=Larkinella sp. TaxID=2034517 RepID=UPI003BAC2D47